jgi:Spherulation-specific family 4/Carbohydrate binding domain (family 11)
MYRGRNTTAGALATVAALGFGTLFAACGAQPDESAEETAAARASSSTIDSFDETNPAWAPFSDGPSTISTARAADHASSSGASLQINYTVGSGGDAGLEREFTSPKNWSSASAINLWVNGQATGHTFLVQVYDAGAERWEARFTVSFSGWQQITIPFSSLTAAGWQPPDAQVNGVKDFSGVTGMALIPSEGTGSGTVTVDALALGAGSAKPATATGGTPGTGGSPAAGGSTGTGGTAAAPPPSSTGGTTAVVPPATPAPVSGLVASTGVNGTIIPLYTDPPDPSWDAVAAAKQAHPTVPVIAIINPADGPGSAADSSYTAGIAKLTAAGVKVLGYVHTLYGSRATSELQTEMSHYQSWYPGVTGIFFDEMAYDPGYESYYSALSTYAKSHGSNFTVGNPGTDSSKTYIGTVDVLFIYESDGVPSVSSIGGWHTSYPRQNFGVIPYKVSSMDAAFVAAARPYVGYIYLQSDDLPNPWDSVPGYLSSLVGALQ